MLKSFEKTLSLSRLDKLTKDEFPNHKSLGLVWHKRQLRCSIIKMYVF